MTRPRQRQVPILELLCLAWERRPDWRLGQLIANAARDPHKPPGQDSRDPYHLEDDELWLGLKRLARR